MLTGWFLICSFQKRIADCRLWPVEITRVPLVTVPKGKPGKLEKVNVYQSTAGMEASVHDSQQPGNWDNGEQSRQQRQPSSQFSKLEVTNQIKCVTLCLIWFYATVFPNATNLWFFALDFLGVFQENLDDWPLKFLTAHKYLFKPYFQILISPWPFAMFLPEVP